MSHNINYCSYPENCNRRQLQADCDEVAIHEDWQEGCSGVSPIRWLDNVGVCEDRDSAQAYIDKVDKGWYDCLAVRYKSPKGELKSKTLDTLEARQTEAYKKYTSLENKLHFEGVKSSSVGCKNCGSKIATGYLKGNYCPVCRTDMRPQSTLDRIKSLKESYNSIRDKVTAERKKLTEKNYVVKWLVKYEYHT